jgi:hypothetical protein
MLLVMVAFGILSFLGSLVISGKGRSMDRSVLALSIVFIAWGSLVLGMFVSSAHGSIVPAVLLK